MSATQGIDQNGVVIEEIPTTGDANLELFKDPSNKLTPLDASKNTMEDTDRLSDTDTQIDISLNKKDSIENKSLSSKSIINENQATKEKINKPTNEDDDTTVKTDKEEAANQSRELKSLLALSKEAKLDTNLSRKRKSLNQRKKAKSEGRFSTGKTLKIQYPVTAESELEMELQSSEGNKIENREEESTSGGTTPKAAKRKKISLSDTSDGVLDETAKKSRRSLTIEVTVFKPNKDMFCWRCHKDGVNISCETCPRSYHNRCLKQTINDPNHWPCPECVSILKAESTQSRSPAMKGMTLEHLCSLLKFAVNRMIQCQGSEPFIHAVNDAEFPDYKKYIIQPMDLTLLEKNIKENLYGSTQAFEADAKWILHNSIIFNSSQSKLTTVAKGIIKICKQEMAEIENCPSCYLNANTKKKTWFIEVCPKPHLLVWAKLRGFPFWPGKAMSCKDGTVDVRFFGAHDRAWVPEKECFLYSPKDPNGFRAKRADIEQCVEELNVHVQNLKKIYIEFNYPPFKTPLDPDNEIKQLQIFLPRYKSYFNKHKFAKRQSTEKDKTESKEKYEIVKESRQEIPKEKQASPKQEKINEIYNNEDEIMEGYGTDDETMPEIDTEMRKTLLKKSENDPKTEDHEAEEDDTQVPTNVEPDTSGIEEFILTKAALKSFSVSAESTSTTKSSDSETSSKRPSFDENSPLPIKFFRRNSETKSETTRISDKINRVDISENMEISLGNDDKGSVSYSDNISSSNSECSSDFSMEIKKRPVQVDVDNAEFTISPASKLKMADKLMKRLSDGDGTSEEGSTSGSKLSDKAEQVRINLSNDKLNTRTDLKEKVKEVVQQTEQNFMEPEPSSFLVNNKFEDPVSSTNIVFDNDKSSRTKCDKVANESNLPIINSEDSVINSNDAVLPETTDELNERQKEPEDAINSFPNEIVHDDLDINDTKQELDISDVHHDSVDTNDEEDSESSDETSTDENKPLSALIKDVANKVKENKSSYVETIPKLKIVLRNVRSEEKLDQLLNVNDGSPVKQKESDILRSPVRKSNKTLNELETQLAEKAIREESSKVSSSERDKSTENKSPEKQTIRNKINSPEKVKNKPNTYSVQEEPNKTLQEEDTSKQGEDISQSPIKDNSSSVENKAIEASSIATENSNQIEGDKSPVKIREPPKKVDVVRDIEDDDAMDTLNEVDLNIDKANIINIIHSSLSDKSITTDESANPDNECTSSKPTPSAVDSKKRKMSHEDNTDTLESQNKILKLVSIESIMNKANNNQDNQQKDESDSILKTSLQAKRIVRSTSVQNSPSSSTRSSVHEVLNEDVKSEPESEAELNTIQDLEAKKKYLSALNILEKGEADAQKPKTNEIRTRSKTEEKRERFRVSNSLQVVDNMTKIIDDVAVNYSAVHEGEALPPPKKKPPPLISAKTDGCEIYVKSFAKIVQDTPEANYTLIPVASTKQRARKSFPHPNYSKPVINQASMPTITKELPKMTPSTPSATIGYESVVKVTAKTTMAITSPIAMPGMATLTPQHTPKLPVPPLQAMEGIRPTNGYLILQPPQQENLLLLPPNQTYTSTIPSQMLTVTPCLVSAPTHSPIIRHISQTPQIWNPCQTPLSKGPGVKEPNISESQNYIPQGESGKAISSNSTVRSAALYGSKQLVNGLPEPASSCSTVEVSANVSTSPSLTAVPLENAITVPERPQPVEPEAVVENGESDEFALLNSLIPENVSRAVTEIVRRPPPKLKPRPPGILSQQFCEGTPSSAGPVTTKINSIAHRLGDYFRGMLIETLDDLGKTNNAEATISNLKLEIESLKHKHSIELSEIEKNMCTILRDIQRSIVEDRERLIEETRAACEVESVKRVEEAKSKQWCANCSKEAQFYCCWNTSYCDYPCQQKHWPNHMSKCTQNVNQPTQITPTSAIRPGGQQLILRPANPPTKGGLGRVFSKPIQKVYMNRNIAAPKTMRVQTSAGNLLTMMETSPGTYQVVSSNPLVRTTNSLSSIKPSLISVTSAGNTSINASTQQKNITSKQPIRVLTHPIPVATVLEEDSD